MFTMDAAGSSGKTRLTAATRLTPEDFSAIARALGTPPRRARKSGFVSAYKATAAETVVTLWNGKETVNRAEPGDFIAANLGEDRLPLRDGRGNPNRYVIQAARFPELYALDHGVTEFGPIHRSISTVDVLYVPGGFSILAPWGETQTADDGYIVRNGADIYGNNRETFERTYRFE